MRLRKLAKIPNELRRRKRTVYQEALQKARPKGRRINPCRGLNLMVHIEKRVPAMSAGTALSTDRFRSFPNPRARV